MKLAFVCVGNAGRSQLATALAEAELERRGLEEAVSVVTGGVDPAEHVHPEVIDVLAEHDIDIGNRRPRQIRSSDVSDADAIITMGCDVTAFAPEAWDGLTERWALEHPDGDDLEGVRAQRDELRDRVRSLFDRLDLE